MQYEDARISKLRRQAENRLRACHKDPLKLPPDQLPALIHQLEVHQIELEMQNEELQRSHMELELARNRYADLFEFAPVGYLILDPQAYIVRANSTSAEMLGVHRARLLGKEFYQFFAREHRDTLFRHLRRVFKYQTHQSCESELEMGSGARFVVKLDSVMQPNIEEGGSPQCLTLLSDITELKRTETANRRAKEIAEEINQEKSHLLAAASHDLRQPLQAITTFNDTVKRILEDKEALQLVYKMSASLIHMKDLLNALLNVSQLESGSITPQIREFPVADLLNRIDITCRLPAEKKGLDLHVVPSSAIVSSDPVLLGQILDNLVSNAIRYTETGRVLIGCRHHGSNLRIEVWDTGVGISEDKHGLVFSDFYQIDNPVRDRNKGLGLGLSITARSARLLQSQIKLRSWNNGSLFSIETPLVAVERNRKHIPASTTVGKKAVPATSLLLVDDDDIVRFALTFLLETYGYKVTAAMSGQEVLALIEEGSNSFDIMITDYLLPNGETGVELIKTVRQVLGRDIPALVITGNLEVASTNEVEALGLRVLQKPVLAEELNGYIQELMA